AVLDFKFQGLLSSAFVGRADEETAFQGQFWFYLNSAAVTFQFVLTPMLLSFVALRWVHLLMPLVQVGAIAWALMSPSVMSVGAAFFFFKMFDYSLFRGAKELIYLPLSFNARYRAKEFIDVFGYRTGKGGSSLVILALQKLGLQMMNYYLFIALGFALLWLLLIVPLTSEGEPQLETQ
ncbi:MAG: Npt1/Npt2 family nucleotide transporter, partial [Betaproteobacteria bacterium]